MTDCLYNPAADMKLVDLLQSWFLFFGVKAAQDNFTDFFPVRCHGDAGILFGGVRSGGERRARLKKTL